MSSIMNAIIILLMTVCFVGADKERDYWNSLSKCEKMCAAVRCRMADKAECENNDQGIYMPRNVKECRCCSSCWTKLYEGQECGEGNKLKVGAACDQGLRCELSSDKGKLICIKTNA